MIPSLHHHPGGVEDGLIGAADVIGVGAGVLTALPGEVGENGVEFTQALESDGRPVAGIDEEAVAWLLLSRRRRSRLGVNSRSPADAGGFLPHGR